MRRIRLPSSRPPADDLPAPRAASITPDDALHDAARRRAAVEAVISEDGFDRDRPLVPQIRLRLQAVG